MKLRRDGKNLVLDTERPVAGFDNLRVVWSGNPPMEGAMAADKLARLEVVGPDGSDELSDFLDQLPESAVKVEVGGEGNGIPKTKTRRRQASAGVLAGVSVREPYAPPPASWEGWRTQATMIAAKWIVKEKYVNIHFTNLAQTMWPEFYLANGSTPDTASLAAREQLAVDIKLAVSDSLKLTEENPTTLFRDLLAMALRDVAWTELSDVFLKTCRNYVSLSEIRWGL